MQLPAPPSACPPQTSPAWQLSPAQHAAPLAPQLSHVAGVFCPGGLLHPRPALQVSLAQQGCPAPPHLRHALTVPPSGLDVCRHSSVDWHWFEVLP
jgi:hypothetical protein